MGALASAELLKTIYEDNGAVHEQELPVVVVLSDPTFPDRTECLLTGHSELLLARFSRAIDTLVAAGCGQIVICCMTIHALLPMLRPQQRAAIVPVSDVLLRSAKQSGRRNLMLCSTGSRRLKLFETHPLWPSVADKILFLDDDDQERLHEMIYRVKTGVCGVPEFAFLAGLRARYDAGFIAGCSEIHLVMKRAQEQGREAEFPCIDPFREIAGRIRASRIRVADAVI
jgi:aspartate racemase